MSEDLSSVDLGTAAQFYHLLWANFFPLRLQGKPLVVLCSFLVCPGLANMVLLKVDICMHNFKNMSILLRCFKKNSYYEV